VSDTPVSNVALPIHEHTTLEANGHQLNEQNVFCPFRGRSIAVEECAECYDCESIVPAEGRRSAFVSCRRLVPGATPEVGQKSLRQVLAEPVASAALTELVCVHPDVPVSMLASMLIERRADAAAVVDHGGRPIGVVSKTDVVRGSLDGRGSERRALEEGEADPRGTTAAVMTAVVHSVRETTPLGQAVALMASEGVHQLPVVGGDGKVVAMLSTRDVMRAVARAEGFLVPDR